jgi:hypothetical protein
MLSSNAVIFAAWCNHPTRFSIYVEDLLRHFKPENIYVGLQPAYADVALSILQSKGITNIALVTPELELSSDASAFQACLPLLKDTQYKVIHFVHTKGTSYDNNQQWRVSKQSYFDNYLNNIPIVEEKMQDPLVGGVGLVGEISPLLDKSDYVKYVTRYGIPHRTHILRTMWLTTHYGIR